MQHISQTHLHPHLRPRLRYHFRNEEHGLRLLVAMCLLPAAVILGAYFELTPRGPRADGASLAPALASADAEVLLANVVVKPIIREDEWRRVETVEEAPAILQTGFPGYQFQNQRHLPVAQIDGRDTNGKLPSALWLKLEQPGNAFVFIETEEGTFVKALEEVSPGFVSRCKLDVYSFGTSDGKPAVLDRETLGLKRLWVVQDAQPADGQPAGWIALAPPPNTPDMIIAAKK